MEHLHHPLWLPLYLMEQQIICRYFIILPHNSLFQNHGIVEVTETLGTEMSEI
jgi:hypothetical protein